MQGRKTPAAVIIESLNPFQIAVDLLAEKETDLN
jgi:hypothetical protein